MHPFNKILLIDEDRTNNLIIQKLTNNLDFTKELSVCSSGQDALNLLSDLVVTNEALPDLIFLDIKMPEMDGWEFLKAYKRLKNTIKIEIPILIVSSSGNPRDKQKAVDFPEVKGYYEKPLTIAKLEEIKGKYAK